MQTKSLLIASVVICDIEWCRVQVGEDVNLNRIHRLAAMYMWTKVYVVKHGQLLGVVNLDKLLTQVRGEEAPVLEAL